MDVLDTTSKALLHALNYRQMRQEIISSNVANSETPGYKAKRLDFEDALARAINIDSSQSLHTQNNKHFDVGGGGFKNLKPETYEDPNGVVNEDGNTVEREAEMARMAENKIMYDATIQMINKKLGLKKYILSTER
jgi:flagellar basal-body rod protein FlgB